MRSLSPVQRLWCTHEVTTPDDGEGYAICVRCLGVVAVRLTRTMFDAAWRRVLENAG